jgi:aspartyl-tRNA(Asn)/glutamyl-tRNA(Gln) amidotransferase subunit C
MITSMDKEEVLKLAKLARIDLSDTEATNLSREIESILDYVSQVKGATKATSNKLEANSFAVRNVMREDTDPHESGIHTESLLAEAPARDGNYLKVKKIL